MADILLPATTFTATAAPSQRPQLRNTIIEDEPQISIRRAAPRMPVPKQAIASPMSDDFPTPRAMPDTAGSMLTLCFPLEERATSPSSTASSSQQDSTSTWSNRSSTMSFDSMYDVSDAESEDVPIKLSASIKRRVAPVRQRPTLNVHAAKKQTANTTLSPSITVQLSPAILRKFASQSVSVPATASAPSLDGSLTSEELAVSSCPSTPDISNAPNANWDAPIQLDPSAFNVLQHISGTDDQQHTIIEVPEEAAQEMREIVESPSRFGGLQLQTSTLAPSSCTDDELSALSIPSPGNFFSSLDSAFARRAWAGNNEAPTTSIATEFYGLPFPGEAPLPTSTAAEFYGVPWRTRPDNAVEHTITIKPAEEEDEEPLTARRLVQTTTEPSQEVDEIDENYHNSLEETAAVNIDRTQMWLSTQKAYIDNVLGEDEESAADLEHAISPIADTIASPLSPNSKKSVRFVDTSAVQPVKTEVEHKRVSPIHDGTFWEAFCHQKRSARARDVFQHRQMRAEAEQVRRHSSTKGHAGQLKGLFELAEVKAARPASGFTVNDGEDTETKEQIARAERERQALEQIQPSAWHVQAQKELNGGTLLTSPIVETFKHRFDVKILDIAGQTHCSWAWDVAVTHPHATVYTTVSSDVEAHIAESSLEGPPNHCVIAAPKPWELPFEDDLFDVVSARNLYMHLRTHIPSDEIVDEWDLTLRECMRVLKPGGYLEFDLLDAEIMQPQASAQALGVEFAFNLKTRGYDPCSGKNFLPRLKRAGFRNIKRAWMILPLANTIQQWSDPSTQHVSARRVQTPASSASAGFGFSPEMPNYSPPLTGSTTDVRAITGLVGARSWEQWMLKVNAELGRDETRCLEGVSRALEESGQGSSGFRCLIGWAQKL